MTREKSLLAFGVLLLAIGLIGPRCDVPDGIPPFVEPRTYPGAWVLLVEESAERSTDAAIFQADTAYQQSLKARGLKWRIYDDDSADAAKFRDIAESVGFPALVITHEGNVLHKQRWPSDGLDQIVKRETGL